MPNGVVAISNSMWTVWAVKQFFSRVQLILVNTYNACKLVVCACVLLAYVTWLLICSYKTTVTVLNHYSLTKQLLVHYVMSSLCLPGVISWGSQFSMARGILRRATEFHYLPRNSTVPWKQRLAAECYGSGPDVYWLNGLNGHISVKVNLYSHVVGETCCRRGS